LLLVGAANLGAYAATGAPLLLGKSNTASKTTKLKTTGNGAALSLKSRAGKAPLKVSNSKKVTKLNADLVDGQSADSLLSRAYVFNLTAVAVPTEYVSFALPGLPPGRYLATFDIAVAVAGGSPPFVGCYLVHGTSPAFTASVLGTAQDTNGYVVLGSGYVDTTTNTHRLVCQRPAVGTSMTIPANSVFPAHVVFTRLDDVSVVGAAGTPTTAP
jgi:hypothetical protein